MSTRTSIEWTEQTWNPAVGCSKVSPGCAHCYAEAMAKRLQVMGVSGYENGFALTLLPHRLEEPLNRRKTKGTIFDTVKKEIKDGVLTVTGERKITETAPGLGGSFTFCTLGEPIEIENLLTGKGLPSFESLARYVFYTATGRSLEAVAKPSPDGFIGETELFRIHLFYQPDTAWLRSNEAALNAERVAAIAKGNKSGKRSIVFAVAKFMSQKELTKERIEFCQLPYAVHRILGD